MLKETTLPESTCAVLSVAQPFRRGAAAAGLPQRVKILGWGENIGRTTGARILVDEVVAETLSGNQELVSIERVPMDYEHQSVKGHPNYRPDPRHSPGSGVIEVVPGEGVYLSAIDYTANGEVHAGDYLDVSGVVHLDKDGRPLWVSSVALTQTGDVAGMLFSEAVAALSARNPNLPTATPNQTKPTPTMDTPNPFRDLLIKFLKLPDTATDEEITAKAAQAAETETPMENEVETAALSARMDKFERTQLLAQAAREGKVIPLSAEEVDATPVAVLSSIISRLPGGEVPLDAKGGKEKPAEKVAVLSADESAVARQLGLTPEQYLSGKVTA